MNILYLHQYYQTREHYGITRSHEMARHLAARGHRVTIITGDRSYQSGAPLGRGGWMRASESDGIRVVTVSVCFSYRRGFVHRAGAFAAYFLLAIMAAARLGPFDVVLATSPPLTAGVAGVIISRLKRCPLVFEVRDLWPEVIEQLGVVRGGPALRLLYAMARFVYHRSARVVALTEGVRDYLVARWSLAPERVALVAHGSDLDLFEGKSRDEARRRLGFGDECVAVYTGAMGIANRLELLVEAAGLLKSSLRLLLIGEGMERARLIRKVEEMGLGNVSVLAPVGRQQVADYLLAADIGLISLRSLPVFHSTIPSKFYDYLAAGLPVVVNFPGDLARLVEEEGIGIYAGDNQPERLAAALDRLCRDPQERTSMGQRAATLARTRFDRITQAAALEQVLLFARRPQGTESPGARMQ